MPEIPRWRQVSVNITKPGMAKGGHWHHTKTEKLVVVSGSGMIRFRKLGDDKVLLYPVTSDNLEVVDIPPGILMTLSTRKIAIWSCWYGRTRS